MPAAKKAVKKIYPVKSALPQLNSAKGGPASLDLTGRSGLAKQEFNRTGKKEKVEIQVTEEVKPKLRIKLRAYDYKIIDNSARQIIDIATRYGAEVVGPTPLPTEILKFTVNRSSFVHKDAREQFEMRVHKRIIDILNLNPDILEALRDMNLPSGVDITIKI